MQRTHGNGPGRIRYCGGCTLGVSDKGGSILRMRGSEVDSSVSWELSSDVNESILRRVGILGAEIGGSVLCIKGLEIDSSISWELSSDVNESILWRAGILGTDSGGSVGCIKGLEIDTSAS